jgi:hypothetical protein
MTDYFDYNPPGTQEMFEAELKNRREAFALLDLINAEFRSDPMSVQCFDARIVERVRECVDKHKKFVAQNPLMK